MSDQKEYLQFKKELQPYIPVLSNAADTIVHQNVSSYPIFVIHQQIVDIGILIVDKEVVDGNWSVNASSLEEFVAKQIISNEKLENFRRVFKDPSEELCLFLLSDLGAKFIFIPR